MKKNEIRSLLRDQERAYNARKNAQIKFFLSLMLLFAVVAVATIFNSPESVSGVALLGGTSFASMMAIGNIEDVGDREVTGNAIGYKVWLIETSQLDADKFPAPNNSREISTLPMLEGEKMHYFVAHAIPTYGSTGERGDLTISSTNTFAFIMGGVRDQILNFLEQKTGCKFIIIFQECESKNKYILGNPCKPMIFSSYELKNDADNRSVTCTFTSTSILQYHKYVGTLVTQAPADLVADATTLALKAGIDTYNVPDGSEATYDIASVSGLTANDKGRVITLIGKGAANAATITDGTTFILEDGAKWTAKAGSQISLRILDASTLVEIQGSRIQTS